MTVGLCVGRGLGMQAGDVVAGAVGMTDMQRDRGVWLLTEIEDLDPVVVVDFSDVGRVDEVQFHRAFLVVVDIVVTYVQSTAVALDV
jgi:hypothetical protein